MSENSDKYRRAVTGFSAVVDQVSKDKWSAVSPCDGWTAKHVIGHVIAGSGMVAQAVTGKAPDFGDPLVAAGDDPAASYAAARELALSAMTDEHLAKKIAGPMGEMPLDQILGMFMTNDVLIHTWDLAKAVGIKVDLDAQLVEEAYAALQPMDAMIRMPNVFGPKVEPPAGADATTKLMCFVGRQP